MPDDPERPDPDRPDPDRPDFDRPGFHDLVTPFIFVPHGAPDPVAWKRANPGWVSFPATFIPHKKSGRQYTVINGRRWPLDKRGQPWPRSRFGQPLCPLDEFPPGVPAPGTQGKLIEEQQAAIRLGVEAFLRRETSVEWFLETGARYRAERDAREAANPTPPSAPWAHTYDPMAPARSYLAMMAQVDAYTNAYAGGARQRNAMRAEAARPAAAAEQQSSEKVREHPIEGVQQSDAAEAELAHPAAATEQQPTEKGREQPTEGVQQPSAAEAEAARPAAATEQQPGDEAREQSQAAGTAATEPVPVELPPGTHHAPLVPLMNRILAVREGEDVSGLRREISAAFYAHDDVTGGNQVNMYLSELVEAGVTDAHRREIAAALGRYAKADPEETGQLRKNMVGGVLAGAAGLLRFFTRRKVAVPSTATIRGKLTGSLEGLQTAERKFVEELLASGRNVEIIPTSHRKTADFFIDGVKTELKTISGIKSRDIGEISASISNRIVTA